jgi:hypothetical protein
LKILILFFCHLKSIRILKKIGYKNDLQTKLEHLKKLVKKIAILIYPPFGNFRKKNCSTNSENTAKKLFFEVYHF